MSAGSSEPAYPSHPTLAAADPPESGRSCDGDALERLSDLSNTSGGRLMRNPLGSGWETLAQLRSCSQAALLCISSATMSLLTSTLSAKAYFSFQLGQDFGGRRSGRQLKKVVEKSVGRSREPMW